MVSSASALATRAGLDLLAAGGTAFDAAVGIAAALNVTEPENSGIGGYGTILLYDAARHETVFLNASGRIPFGARGDELRLLDPEHRSGAKSISTPGNLHAWEALWRRGGVLPWADLFAPALRAARDGFPLSPHTAKALNETYGLMPPAARAVYGDGTRPMASGERLVQADLGATLARIAAEGVEPFYSLEPGSLGARIVAEVEVRGGYLAARDLQGDRAEEWPSIGIRYRGKGGHEIRVPAPPANSFPALVRLGILSRFDLIRSEPSPLSRYAPGSADWYHLFADVTRRGTACRLTFAGDPEIAPPPLDRLLSEAFWQEEADDFDPLRAQTSLEMRIEAPGARHTTHFVVADEAGNVVSATQTIGNLFGSRVYPPGTGIWLNDSLAYCTPEPPGNPMDVHPGRHKLSGDCPAFVMRDGRPWIVLGTPGGHTIDQTVPWILVHLLDFGMGLEEALAAPRLSFVEPGRLVVEASLPEAIRDDLIARGHPLRVRGPIGNAHAVILEYDSQGRPNRFTGAADPRGDGLALGL